MGLRLRKAAHAGSWYTSNGNKCIFQIKQFYYFEFSTAKELDSSLNKWLVDATMSHGPAKAVITPYVFCVRN